MLFLLLGVHALFFGLTTKGIKDYEGFFKDVVVAGECNTLTRLVKAVNPVALFFLSTCMQWPCVRSLFEVL